MTVSDEKGPYRGEERRQSPTALLDEVSGLKLGLDTLSSRVQSLAGEMGRVNELIASQQEIDRKASEAVYAAQVALREASEVKQNALPRSEHAEEIKRVAAEQLTRLREQRSAVTRNIVIASCIGLMILFLSYVSLHQSQQSVKNACRERVKNSSAAATEAERLMGDPRIAGDNAATLLLQRSRDLSAQAAQVRC